MNKLNKNTQNSGFIRLILLVIIVLVIMSFYGYNPQVLWMDFILPVILFVWGIIVWIVSFLVGLIKAGWAAVEVVLNIIQSIGN